MNLPTYIYILIKPLFSLTDQLFRQIESVAFNLPYCMVGAANLKGNRYRSGEPYESFSYRFRIFTDIYVSNVAIHIQFYSCHDYEADVPNQ
jgi:hypothetical protein